MSTQNYPTDVWFDIATLINVAQPSSIALLGDFKTEFVDEYQQQREILGLPLAVQRFDCTNLDEFTEPVDVAVVANLIEHLEKRQATRLISRLRDILSGQFCICLPLSNGGSADWQQNELFALGLQMVSSYSDGLQEFGLFKYHLKEYKQTPDWLNPDNWANPQMWGKYWW